MSTYILWQFLNLAASANPRNDECNNVKLHFKILPVQNTPCFSRMILRTLPITLCFASHKRKFVTTMQLNMFSSVLCVDLTGMLFLTIGIICGYCNTNTRNDETMRNQNFILLRIEWCRNSCFENDFMLCRAPAKVLDHDAAAHPQRGQPMQQRTSRHRIAETRDWRRAHQPAMFPLSELLLQCVRVQTLLQKLQHPVIVT